VLSDCSANTEASTRIVCIHTSLLNAAVQLRNLKIMAILLDAGAHQNGPVDMDSGPRHRYTIIDQPLRAAMQLNRADILEVLLERGATLAGSSAITVGRWSRCTRPAQKNTKIVSTNCYWLHDIERRLP
jgi:hypothetical protein